MRRLSTRPDAENMVFLGTSVVSGTCDAPWSSPPAPTHLSATSPPASPPAPEPTSFDRGLKDFSLLLTRTVLFLVVFLIVVGVFTHRNPLQSLLFAVALAVGLTPEFLPMIVSVTLSKGARAMARKKVIVKHLSAIQNFGSIDVLCSDKTGTLTSGNMTLDQRLDPFGDAVERASDRWRGSTARFETGIRSPLDTAILKGAEPEEEARLREARRDPVRLRAPPAVHRGGARRAAAC